MKLSNCCGVPPASIGDGDCDTSEFGLCPECRDHCEYEEEEEVWLRDTINEGIKRYKASNNPDDDPYMFIAKAVRDAMQDEVKDAFKAGYAEGERDGRCYERGSPEIAWGVERCFTAYLTREEE